MATAESVLSEMLFMSRYKHRDPQSPLSQCAPSTEADGIRNSAEETQFSAREHVT